MARTWAVHGLFYQRVADLAVKQEVDTHFFGVGQNHLEFFSLEEAPR